MSEMGGRGRRNVNRRPAEVGGQVLSRDYWEGYYASGRDILVRCTDADDHVLRYEVFDLRKGALVKDGTFGYGDETAFSEVSAAIGDVLPVPLALRVSDAVGTPDRQSEIDRILEEGDGFAMFRIRDLVKRLLSRGINVFNDPVGRQDLYEDGYEGFYLLQDGNVMYCRDGGVWDPDGLGCIADGVVAYVILPPASFRREGRKDETYGFLRGDLFSDLEETLYPEHGKVVRCLGKRDEEMFELLMQASEGNKASAARASHHLRLDLHV